MLQLALRQWSLCFLHEKTLRRHKRDGTEALELFTSYNGDVDLVVSDVVMPEMDGPTLMKHLRSERPDVKIIFISGYAEDAFRRNLSDKEDFMFLQKPFDLKELAAAVKAALQG